MTSRAARRRRKNTISLPNAAPVAAPRGPGRKPKEDPMATVLKRRLSAMGADDCPEARADARSPMAGCPVGLALLTDRSINRDTRAALWGAVCHVRRVVANYDRACGAPGRHPRCMSILAPAEHIEATAESPPPDMRDDDERYRAAVREWMAYKGWISYADYAARAAMVECVVDEGERVKDWEGVKMALACVADGMAGRKIVDRRRV